MQKWSYSYFRCTAKFCTNFEMELKEFKVCALCRKIELAFCAKYCSKECQVSDWKAEHKMYHALTSKGLDTTISVNIVGSSNVDLETMTAALNQWKIWCSRFWKAKKMLKCPLVISLLYLYLSSRWFWKKIFSKKERLSWHYSYCMQFFI